MYKFFLSFVWLTGLSYTRLSKVIFAKRDSSQYGVHIAGMIETPARSVQQIILH